MSKRYDGPTRVGQLRPSQLVHSFGVGALIDLPHLTVMVSGLHDWQNTFSSEIREERLLELVRMRPEMRRVSSLKTAPWMVETQNVFDQWARVGVPVLPFPRWLRCPWGSCQYLGPIDDGQWELDQNAYRPDQASYRHKNCRKKGKGATGLPVRFLIACERGHLDEFPWVDYVHRGSPCASPLLELSERGQSTGPADVFITCRTCPAQRTMKEAFGESAETSLPKCRGRHPHLGQFDDAGCDDPARTLLLGASNGWFGDQHSVLSIPAGSDPLPALVSELWSDLEEIQDRTTFDLLIRRDPKLSRLTAYPDDDVWTAITAHRSGAETTTSNDADQGQPDILGPEWHQFTHPDTAPASDDFLITATDPPDGFDDHIERVVLAERLREVVALTGFTRLSAPVENTGNIAPLSKRPPEWVPAVEVRGEGVFIQLAEAAVSAWEDKYQASESYERLFEAHKNWRSNRGMEPLSGWPGARYVLLHTLSHALIREFALDCGYASSSIRERIYSRSGPEPMAGILLYTAASDSEGTLGGLVSLGEPERLSHLLTNALSSARICTSDPTCAEHLAGELRDEHLHGAACHACLFASETSCEQGNRYLDRGVLKPTIAGPIAPFFG